MDDSLERPRPVPQVAIVVGLPLMSAALALCAVAALLWRRDAADVWHTAWHAAAFAAGWAALVGVPAAHWASSTDRRGIHQWIGLGAAAGALLVIVPFAGHLIGALLRGETRVLDLTWDVLLRAILETLGLGDLLRGRRALLLVEALPVLTGALTGAMFWLLVVRSGRSRR